MKTIIRNLALGAAAIVLLLVAVVAVRTATFAPAQAPRPSALAAATPVDEARAAERLAQAVRFRTISHQDPAQDDPEQWARLHAWLAETYPAAHAAMTLDKVAERTLIYSWTGSNPALAPIVLMAHQDVVPVTEGTEGEWTHPPFAGVVADGAVWGRGSIDDKSSLVLLMEAAEALALRGFKPVRTVLFVFGHDEERGGTGAQAAAAWMQARGLKAEFVLDEGMAVIEDHPVTGGPAALIGVAEKGYATLRVTARATGGHSSTPPDETGVQHLARAVLAIADDPFPRRFEGPTADMLRALAPHASLPVRVAVANAWLLAPVLVSQVAATPAGSAMLHTTIAPTMLEGSPKENVLPQAAKAWINYRLAPGDRSEAVLKKARAAVGDAPVSLEWDKPPNEATAVSSTASRGYGIIAALAAEAEAAPVAPALMIAATDSRFMQGVAQDVYRFQPMRVRVDALSMIHGTDEHMSTANVGRMARFYTRFIATAAAQ